VVLVLFQFLSICTCALYLQVRYLYEPCAIAECVADRIHNCSCYVMHTKIVIILFSTGSNIILKVKAPLHRAIFLQLARLNADNSVMRRSYTMYVKCCNLSGNVPNKED